MEDLEQKFVNPVFYWIILANWPGDEWDELTERAVKGWAEDITGEQDEPLL